MEATGILAGLAKTAGYKSVAELLKFRPDAPKTVKLARKNTKHALKEKLHQNTCKNGGGLKSPFNFSKVVRSCPQNRRSLVEKVSREDKMSSEDMHTVQDSLLGPRQVEMPELGPLSIHFSWSENREISSISANRPTNNAENKVKKSARTINCKMPRWMRNIETPINVPDNVEMGQLVCILEFLSTFGKTVLNLDLALEKLPIFAAELLQPIVSNSEDVLCPALKDSLVASVHVELLKIVRKAWGLIESQDISHSWQKIMATYFSESEALSESSNIAQRQAYGCPAVAVEFADGAVDSVEKTSNLQCEHTIEGCTKDLDMLQIKLIPYPDANTGYWSVPSHVRVKMLYSLIHDALETYIFREKIEAGFEEAERANKAHKSLLAQKRREMRELQAQEHNKRIALLIAKAPCKAMSLEEQQKIVREARRRVEESCSKNDVIGPNKSSQNNMPVLLNPRSVRSMPLGSDRDGAVYFNIQSGPVLTGDSNGLVVIDREGKELKSQTNPSIVLEALDGRGHDEGMLQQAIRQFCNVN